MPNGMDRERLRAAARRRHREAGHERLPQMQNLDRRPAHAAFALATSLVAMLAPVRTRGALLRASTAALSAAWFGATLIAFPDHDGSLGATGGWLALAWGVAPLAAVLVRGAPRRRPAAVTRSGGASAPRSDPSRR